MSLEKYQWLSVEISPEDEVSPMPDKFNWCSLFLKDWKLERMLPLYK